MLDSSALIAFLFGEPCAPRIADLFDELLSRKEQAVLSAVNWSEVVAILERRLGPDGRADVVSRIAGLPIRIVDADRDLAEHAATLKVRHALALADAFAAALADRMHAVLWAKDQDFKSVEKIVRIVWL